MNYHEQVTIGVVSDTHGLLRDDAVAALQGVSQILHAGDVGDPEILDQLAEIAPVTAVRGNVDRGDWANELPEWETVEVGDHLIYLRHIREEIDLNPYEAGVSCVIFGHTHSPLREKKGSVIWFNPGSIGPRRFSLPISMGLLHIDQDGTLDAELIELG